MMNYHKQDRKLYCIKGRLCCQIGEITNVGVASGNERLILKNCLQLRKL